MKELFISNDEEHKATSASQKETVNTLGNVAPFELCELQRKFNSGIACSIRRQITWAAQVGNNFPKPKKILTFAIK